MSKEPFMYRPKLFAGRLLVWLAAVTLPVQSASVLAGCCDQASRPGAEAKHRPCCGDSSAPSPPSKCQRGHGCSCCCSPQKQPPASAPSVPTARHRPPRRDSVRVPRPSSRVPTLRRRVCRCRGRRSDPRVDAEVRAADGSGRAGTADLCQASCRDCRTAGPKTTSIFIRGKRVGQRLAGSRTCH